MRNSPFLFLKKHGWDILLGLLIVLEVAFMLYFHKGILPNNVNEVGFSLTSILIGVVVLLKYYGHEVSYVPAVAQPQRPWLRLLTGAILLFGMVGFCISLSGLFSAMPYNAGSDIIPTLQVAVGRLLSGETVYKTIDEWGYQLPLTYLPMQWLPYTIAELIHIDYRWVAIGICFAAMALIVVRCSKVAPVHGLFAALLFIYTGRMLLLYDTGILTMTVELMVAGYYMLLIAGLAGRNPWLRGAAIAVCLLSRYSLVLWLPLWAFTEFMCGGRRDFFRSCVMITLLVLVIYIIPFLSHDWGAFARGYYYYSSAALGEWSNTGGEHHVPFQLDNGLGFARLFYLKLMHYTIPDRIKSLQKVHFVICIGSAVAMGGLYWLLRRRIHPRIFLFGSFKIYISLFLAFIQVPYPYLMITAAAVSIAIFAELARWRVGQLTS